MMKNLLKTTAAAMVLSVGLVAPAHADVQVTGTVDVDKDITIDVATTKTKTVDVNVTFDAGLEGSAQSDAVVNATIDNVSVGPFKDNINDENIDKESRTVNSVNRNTGIVQFNQDAGQVSNQGNVVSVAAVFTGDSSDDTTVVMSEAYVDQRITRSDATHREGIDNLSDDGVLGDKPFDDIDLVARITGSYRNNVGIVQGNQNVGNGNNQHNVLSAAVGDNALVALSDAGLGQEIAGNSVTDINTLKEARVVDSMTGNTGIISVNQASGAFNNQATVISIAALSSAVGLGQ